MSETDEQIFKLLVVDKLNGELSFEFSGCDECEEWDGESARCSCGNRRVCWVLSDDKTEVYPEAY